MLPRRSETSNCAPRSRWPSMLTLDAMTESSSVAGLLGGGFSGLVFAAGDQVELLPQAAQRRNASAEKSRVIATAPITQNSATVAFLRQAGIDVVADQRRGDDHAHQQHRLAGGRRQRLLELVILRRVARHSTLTFSDQPGCFDQVAKVGIRPGGLADARGIAVGEDLVGLRIDHRDFQDRAGVRHAGRAGRWPASGRAAPRAAASSSCEFSVRLTNLVATGLMTSARSQRGLELLLHVVGQVDARK